MTSQIVNRHKKNIINLQLALDALKKPKKGKVAFGF